MKYHPYGNIDPFIIPAAADKMLSEYWDVAENLGIRTCLYYGTVLGFARDHGYIKGDNDIDVAIFGGLETLAPGLINAGFKYLVLAKNNIHFMKYQVLLDIYFNDFKLQFFQQFDKIIYNGRAYNVPHPVFDYLEDRYGDWRVKKLRKVFTGQKVATNSLLKENIDE